MGLTVAFGMSLEVRPLTVLSVERETSHAVDDLFATWHRRRVEVECADFVDGGFHRRGRLLRRYPKANAAAPTATEMAEVGSGTGVTAMLSSK